MFKKILMSALALGALAATIGGATYAPWSSSATASGSVSSGSITLVAGTPVLTVATTCANLAPGDTCDMTVDVGVGSSSLTQTYTATPTLTGDLNTCASGGPGATLSAVSLTFDSGVNNFQIAPGGYETVKVTLTMGGDDGCQDKDGGIQIAFNGALSANPHTDLN